MFKNIGFGITGSFCTHEKTIEMIKGLVNKGYNVLPIITESVKSTNTRFGDSKSFIEEVEKITGKKVIDNIIDAEPIGPKNLIDVMVVAPCTGNSLSKIANGLTDNAVLMVTKSHVRNNKPVVIGISTNDALGANAVNLAKLLNYKNYYFIPFGQDNPQAKPKSLIANWDLLEETLKAAYNGNQFQPILLRGDK